MVSEVRIYLEGGGDSKDTKAAIRRGFSKFLGPLRDQAREQRLGWRIVACGPRSAAFDGFLTALKIHPDAFNVLLVDAEGPVDSTLTRWEHLRSRDGWDTPPLADEHCHLIVQMVEAWFVADLDALRAFYGQGFHENAIPKDRDVEKLDRKTLESGLKRATRHTTKGPYHKIHHAAKLLESLNSQTVRSKAPHCDRLFETLARTMEPPA